MLHAISALGVTRMCQMNDQGHTGFSCLSAPVKHQNQSEEKEQVLEHLKKQRNAATKMGCDKLDKFFYLSHHKRLWSNNK